MQVNPHSGVPLWRQISDALAEQIRDGEIAVGDPAPSYRELEKTWSVSPSTAMSALADLRRRGLVSAGRGTASRVERTPHVVRGGGGARYRHGDDVSPVQIDLDRDDHSGEIRGQASVEPASRRIASRLGIATGDLVSRIDYYWEDETSAIQRSTQWEPLAITSGTPIEVPPVSGEPNVISRMASIGHRVTRVREQMLSRMPKTEESEELQIDEGIPIIEIQRTHYADSIAVETANITIRGDRMVIVTDHPVEDA